MKAVSKIHRLIAFGILAAAGWILLYPVLTSRINGEDKIVALWMSRFEYTTPDDVRAAVRNAAAAGFSDLFFQIRGNGTVYYESGVEPWAYELSGREVRLLGTCPGWDPLNVALDCAHEAGLRLHAYINVLPGWRGKVDPLAASGQLWITHREWFMVDALGDTMRPPSGWYAFLNPVLPKVRQHILRIVSELSTRPIDGLHLDYIRYPHDYPARRVYPHADHETLKLRSDFSHDPASKKALLERYGEAYSHADAQQFRIASVTRLVNEIEHAFHIGMPEGILSASVMGNPVEGLHLAYQDSVHWARSGAVDWVVQMNYGAKTFKPYLEAMCKATGWKTFKQSVVVGVGCNNSTPEILSQLDTLKRAGCRGVALFSYGSLFNEHHEPTPKGKQVMRALENF